MESTLFKVSIIDIAITMSPTAMTQATMRRDGNLGEGPSRVATFSDKLVRLSVTHFDNLTPVILGYSKIAHFVLVPHRCPLFSMFYTFAELVTTRRPSGR